jgi:hypothetical protein
MAEPTTTAVTTTAATAADNQPKEPAFMSALNVTFEMARHDSPIFRANLQRIEDEVEKMTSWLDGLGRSLRSYLEELNSN